MKVVAPCVTVLVLLSTLSACGDKEPHKTPALDAEMQPVPAATVAPSAAPETSPQAQASEPAPERPVAEPPAALLQSAPEHGVIAPADGIENQQLQRTALAQIQDALMQNQVALDGLNVKLDQLIQRQDRPVAAPSARTRGKVKPEPEKSAAPRPNGAKVPPFAIEAVDLWGGDQRIVINDGHSRRDLKPGDSYAGWTLVGAQDGRVTVRGEQGQKVMLDVQWK